MNHVIAFLIYLITNYDL